MAEPADFEVRLLEEKVSGLARQNDEQFKAIAAKSNEREARYQQRFDAQEKALSIAVHVEEKAEMALRLEFAAIYRTIDEVTLKAQTANDALERLLSTNITAVEAVAVSRFVAADSAIAKTDVAIVKAHDAAVAATLAVEEKVTAHILALQQLVDQRARMGELAIAKAEQATEIRFASVNEFRGQLSDQTREFVTTSVLNARLEQLGADRAGYSIQLSDAKERISKLETVRSTERDGRTDTRSQSGMVTGIIGAGVGLIMMVIAVGGIVISNRGQGGSPIVGADTQRVTDLLARIDAMQRQISQNAERSGAPTR